MVGAAVFSALGAAFAAFGLQLGTLPAGHVDELLQLLDATLYHDRELARCARPFSVGRACCVHRVIEQTVSHAQACATLHLVFSSGYCTYTWWAIWYSMSCRRVRTRDPCAAFVRALLADAQALFPVFPRPYLSLLAATTAGCPAAADSLRALPSATAFFDADAKLAALELRGANVLVADEGHKAFRDLVQRVRTASDPLCMLHTRPSGGLVTVLHTHKLTRLPTRSRFCPTRPGPADVLQIGPVNMPGRLVEWPQLAEGLDTGRGALVQWRLARPAPERNLGFVLTVAELRSRTDALRAICEKREDAEVLGEVAATLETCSCLLRRCALEPLYSRCRAVFGSQHPTSSWPPTLSVTFTYG